MYHFHESSSTLSVMRSQTRLFESRSGRPIPQASWIPSDSYPSTSTRRRTIEQEQLIPTRWANVFVRGRRNRTSIARTADSRKQGTLTHRVAMGTRFRSEHGNARGAAAVEFDGDGDGGAVTPVFVGDGERGARTAG